MPRAAPSTFSGRWCCSSASPGVAQQRARVGCVTAVRELAEVPLPRFLRRVPFAQLVEGRCLPRTAPPAARHCPGSTAPARGRRRARLEGSRWCAATPRERAPCAGRADRWGYRCRKSSACASASAWRLWAVSTPKMPRLTSGANAPAGKTQLVALPPREGDVASVLLVARQQAPSAYSAFSAPRPLPCARAVKHALRSASGSLRRAARYDGRGGRLVVGGRPRRAQAQARAPPRRSAARRRARRTPRRRPVTRRAPALPAPRRSNARRRRLR